MSLAREIRNRITHLNYNQEYSSAIFEGLASQELIKKTLQRSPDLIAKTTTKKFYRKYLSRSNEPAPYSIYDDQESVPFDPSEYTFNAFWQTSKPSTQKASSIIRNYLATMEPKDIQILCRKFGTNRVKSELIQKYKALYKQGYINVKGLEIPLNGRYDRNPAFRELMGIVSDC